MHAAVGEKAGAGFLPAEVGGEVEIVEQFSQARVGEQRDVVVAVPGDVAELPHVGESAEVRGGLDERYGMAGRGEQSGEFDPEDAAADDGPAAAVRGAGRGVERCGLSLHGRETAECRLRAS